MNIISSGYLQSFPEGYYGSLAPCAYDLFIYCKFGVLSFIAILMLIGLVGYIILRIIHDIESKDFKKMNHSM